MSKKIAISYKVTKEESDIIRKAEIELMRRDSKKYSRRESSVILHSEFLEKIKKETR